MANELHIYVDLDVDMVSSKYINCNAKQFDKNTRYLRITCYSENKVYPLSAADHVVYVREGKADGFSVLNLCEIDEQGRIIIQLTEQMLAAQGMNYCDVLIAETGATVVDGEVESNRLLSTMNFCINVIPSPMDTSAIESSYEYNALNDLLERAARDYTYIITEAGAYAAAAEASAQRAAESVGEIGTAVSDAQGYANAASQSAANAASSASAASTSETNASTSASNAATSATNAASSASNASTSETNAHQSEVNAASSASDASDSATAASGSATSAANSASDASDDAELARQWAVGLSGSGQAQPSDTNNAYYWAQVAASAASGGLKPLVVQSLPTTNISTSIVYLVPSSDPKTKNIYDEYLNTTGTTSGWELIGSTGIDLSDYAEISKLSIGFNNGYLQLKYDGTTISQVTIPAGDSKPPVATYDESPALYSHAVDDLIYYNDELYKVTASISVGDSLSTNTNITTNTGIEEGQQVFINKIPGGSGGGGGVSAFEDLTDVDFTNLQNGQVPVYNSQTGKWENGSASPKYALAPCVSITVGEGDTKLVLQWTDPSDIIIGGTVAAEWAGTKIVRKVGSAPTSETDGTVVVTETTRNQYSSSGYEDTGLTNDTTYYYGFFPYTTDGVYNYTATDDGTPTPATVTVTLTVNSAASDTVTITDSNGNEVSGSPVYTNNSGTGSGTVIVVPNEVYTFTSNVAKALDGSNDPYSKNVTLTNSLTQTVSVMPDGTMYWKGNQIPSVTSGWSDINSSFDLSGTTCPRDSSGSTTFETNHIYIESTNGAAYPPYVRQVGTANPINISNYNKLHIIADIYTYSAATDEGGLFASGLRPNKTSSGGNGYVNKENTVLNAWETFHIEKDLSQMTATSAYVVMMTIRKTKARIQQVWCD